MGNNLSKWQLLENATSAPGELDILIKSYPVLNLDVLRVLAFQCEYAIFIVHFDLTS